MSGRLSLLHRVAQAAAAAMVAAALVGCSPAYDWRSVPVEKARLSVSLPCKPDAGQRSVEMGADRVDIAMVGCAARGSLFALSYMTLKDPSQVASTLTLWHDAVRRQLQLPAVEPGKGPAEQPFLRKGALDVPQSIRMKEEAVGPDGRRLWVDAVWFARIDGTSVQLVHAVMYAPTRDDRTADSFLGSIALQ